jgi:hypothetical protein
LAKDFERHVQDDARAEHDRIIDEAEALDVFYLPATCSTASCPEAPTASTC